MHWRNYWLPPPPRSNPVTIDSIRARYLAADGLTGEHAQLVADAIALAGRLEGKLREAADMLDDRMCGRDPEVETFIREIGDMLK